jgi:hypothetical protein
MVSRESIVQQGAVKWFNLQYPQYRGLLVHIPNEGRRTIKVINGRPVCIGGAKLKAEGLVKGAADLVLFVPNKYFHGLCLETKVELFDYSTGKEKKTKTYQSPEQKEWQTLVESQGYRYEVYRNIDEFRKIVLEYMDSKQ